MMKSNTIYIVAFFLMFFVHFALWQYFVQDFESMFIRYYLFLTVLFMIVLTVVSIIKKIYPNYIGFTFLGLLMFKLMLMFLVMKKLQLQQVPNYKIHFIIPYLISLLLETLYAINLIKKDEKNQ